jgi:uncharacterized protein (TIGR02145 family)
MKQFYLFLSFILMLSANALQAQNDSIYFWKNGTLKLKGSIKTADLDSITFKRPVAPIPPVAPMPNVTIGTQVWTTKNLDVTTYRDGTPIPEVKDATAWANLTTGAWCYYENSTANGTTYGKLYNWYAVAGIHDNDPNTPNKVLAPTGWHVPSDAEWTTLTTFLGGVSLAGSKMKATGTSLWTAPNTDSTNSSGFTGLPGGYRSPDRGTFYFVSFGGYWWSSSDSITPSSWMRYVFYDASVYRFAYERKQGHSVRCIRD